MEVSVPIETYLRILSRVKSPFTEIIPFVRKFQILLTMRKYLKFLAGAMDSVLKKFLGSVSMWASSSTITKRSSDPSGLRKYPVFLEDWVKVLLVFFSPTARTFFFCSNNEKELSLLLTYPKLFNFSHFGMQKLSWQLLKNLLLCLHF